MVRKLISTGKKRTKRQDELTRKFYRLIKENFPSVPDEIQKVIYRKPSGLLNLRVIDPAFAGTDVFDREDLLADILAQLPPGTVDRIGLRILLTPDEAKDEYDYVMPKFDDPFGDRD